jgi:hypothetical protein
MADDGQDDRSIFTKALEAHVRYNNSVIITE